MRLRVGTFNILNTCIWYKDRKALIKKAVIDMDCDVIGMQEVNLDGNTEVTTYEEYEKCFAAMDEPLFLPIPEFRIDGVLLLVRKNIEVLEAHRLVYADRRRVGQVLKLRKDGVEFVVANTHLDHLTDVYREAEIRELMAFLERFSDWPCVVTGDFNFDPSSKVYEIMGSQFRSAHKEANGTEPEITYPTRLRNSGALDDEFLCLDYVWVRGKVMVEGSRRFDECGEGDMWASDHYPLYAELVIE
jgi:endonuclease/exonuclease/phosphatase family metal-dependent hydrolase